MGVRSVLLVRVVQVFFLLLWSGASQTHQLMRYAHAPMYRISIAFFISGSYKKCILQKNEYDQEMNKIM